MTAHWGVPDPAAVKGTQEEIDRAFRDAFSVLDRRIGLFLSLPLSTLEHFAIQQRDRRDWTPMRASLQHRIVAEFFGTLFLLAAVVGSGVMAERLAGGNVAIASAGKHDRNGCCTCRTHPCLRTSLRGAP